MTREEAARIIKKRWDLYIHNFVDNIALHKALETLEQPGQKKGKWECDENGDWHCSVCKAIVERDEQINHYWQYCYHCGAEMETER